MKRSEPSSNQAPQDSNKKIRTTTPPQQYVTPLGRTITRTAATTNRPIYNNTYNLSIQTNISQRTAYSLMPINQAMQTNIKKLRVEIIRAEIKGISDNQISELKCILGSKDEASYDEICYTAKWYEDKDDLCNAIKHYERLLSLNNLTNTRKISVLQTIIQISRKKNHSEETTYFCKLLLEIAPKNSRIMVDVYLCLLQTEDHKLFLNSIIHWYQSILNHPLAHNTEKDNAQVQLRNYINLIKDPNKLLEMFYSFSNDNQPELAQICLNIIPMIMSPLSIDRQVIELKLFCITHLNNKNWVAAIELNKKLFTLLNNSEKNTLIHDPVIALKWSIRLLSEVHEKIEFLEGVLAMPESCMDYRIFARYRLSELYLESGDTDKAISFYKETINCSNIHRKLIITFLKNPNINLNEKLNKIRDKNPETQKEIFDILAYHPGLWYGKHKLNDIQWENILNSENNPDEIFDLVFSQYLNIQNKEYISISEVIHSKVYLNQESFLKNDFTHSSWNKLPQRNGPITDTIAYTALNSTQNILDQFCETLSQEKINLQYFVEKCFEGKKEDEDLQLLSKRLIAVTDILSEYIIQLNNNNSILLETEKETINYIIQGAIDILTEGSKRCSDGANTALNDVENYLKLFEYPKYKANIFVNMFKLYAIQDKLTDKNHLENLETHRYYVTTLNSILGLGLIDQTMLYANHAKTLPLEEALSILSEAFTAETLINFTVGSHIFRMLFPLDNKVAKEIKQLEEQYDDTYDTYDTYDIEDLKERYAAGNYILEKIDHIKTSFYTHKAIQMYIDSGFIQK